MAPSESCLLQQWAKHHQAIHIAQFAIEGNNSAHENSSSFSYPLGVDNTGARGRQNMNPIAYILDLIFEAAVHAKRPCHP